MSHRWRDAGFVVIVALTIRLIHLWQIQHAPFFSLLMGDAGAYDAWARQIAAGDWIGHDTFYQAPLYPYVLGVVYALVGHDLFIVRSLQIVAGAVACGLMSATTAKLFGRGAGLAAGLLLALYSPAIFFDALIQKSVLDLLIVCGLLFVIAGLIEHVTIVRAVIAGVLAGSFALTRENALVLVPILIVWLWTRRYEIKHVGALVAGLAIVLAPVALRNRVVGGEWTMTTSQAGPNFYIGNSPNATGMYVPLKSGHGTALYERQDATELAEVATGRKLSAGEVSRYWRQRAWDWISTDRAAWLRLMAKKTLLVWNTREVSDTEDLDTHAEWSWPLRATSVIFSFGSIAPLALLGVWITRARWRDLWIFYAMGVAYAASVAIFYVMARYRYPLVAILMPFSGVAIAKLLSWWRASRRGERVGGLVIVALALVACHWPVLSAASMQAMRAGTHYNVAHDLQTSGQNDDAIAEYRAALALAPGLADAHSNLGLLLAGRGEHDEALRHYRDALRLDPAMSEAHVNLGMELAARRQTADAIASFERAVALDPGNATAHYNLGTLLASERRLSEALPHLEKALALRPDFPEARQNLEAVRAAIRGR